MVSRKAALNRTTTISQQIENLPLASIKQRQRNPRTHSPQQIQSIGRSIRTFGFVNPVLIDEDNNLIAGHGRLAGARLIGLTTVPALRVGGLSPTEIRALVIADNRLAEKAGWDPELLKLEFTELSDLKLDFELSVTGFEMPEIEALFNDPTSPSPSSVDEHPTIDPSRPVITQLGDLWELGPHRLLCGDALKDEDYRRLLHDEFAQMVFTDPPYNVEIPGNVSGEGRVQHPNFAMASGEMSDPQFEGFLTVVAMNLAANSVNGSIHYICMDWRHMLQLLHAAGGAYSELKNLCVWNKTNGGMGSFYRSKHELVFAFKKGAAPHINNFGLGQYGRSRTNVWDYPGCNTFTATRNDDLAAHPTVKPVALVADAMRDCSHRGGLVLDPFIGSGTLFLAAEATGRRAAGLELEPRYCDVAIERWQKLTGREAVNVSSGATYTAMRGAVGGGESI